jgi:hypothetical protein
LGRSRFGPMLLHINFPGKSGTHFDWKVAWSWRKLSCIFPTHRFCGFIWTTWAAAACE